MVAVALVMLISIPTSVGVSAAVLMKPAGHQADDKKTRNQQQNVHIRQDRRHQVVTTVLQTTMKKDHRHGILQHREGQ